MNKDSSLLSMDQILCIQSSGKMKLSTFALVALLPTMGFTQDAQATDIPELPVEARYVAGRVVANGLRYRRCPRTSCAAVGQYAPGTRIEIQCFTRAGTTIENGDA